MKIDYRTIQSLILLALIGCGLAFFLPSSLSSVEPETRPAFDLPMASLTHQAVDKCVGCHETHSDGVVTLFKTSTHGRTGKTCVSCHGGNASATDKAGAHAQPFIGQPSSKQVLEMCGACHSNQLAVFKTSRHFPERRGSPRVDCVQCHGAHSVGSPSRSFSFAYYCSGCHGLEYLPHLPAEFQKTLSMSDDLNDSLRTIAASGGRLSTDEMAAKKEVRRLIAEIVHATDSEGGVRKAPTVQEKIRALSEIVKRK